MKKRFEVTMTMSKIVEIDVPNDVYDYEDYVLDHSMEGDVVLDNIIRMVQEGETDWDINDYNVESVKEIEEDN